MNRAFSVFEIKSVDVDKRILEGVATTPETDRGGDIVEPTGAVFSLPLPFLWQHDREKPIGHVVSAQVKGDGIYVSVQIESDDQPGPLKDTLDFAWSAIKKQLVRGLSIGFMPIEAADIQGTWGERFTKWEWLELSAVTIPANAEATITTVKQYAGAPGKTKAAGVPGVVTVKKNTQSKAKTMNVAEKIKEWEATRAAKAGEMAALMEAAEAKGETLDEQQSQQYDALDEEVKGIDLHLKRLRTQQEISKTTVTPVNGTTTETASTSRGGTQVVVSEKKLEPGVRFARLVKAQTIAKLQHMDPREVVKQMYPDDALLLKTAVAAATTIDGNWGANLVGDERTVMTEFLEFLRPATIVGRFGQNGIPDVTHMPFRTPVITQTAGGDAWWTGEGKAKKLTKLAFSRTHLEELKVATIAVATMESLRSSSPSADLIIRNSLRNSVARRLDIDFIDPSKSASSGVSPASITYGANEIASQGEDADGIRADIRAAFQGFIDADNPPTTGVWIMSATNALAASLMVNALGQSEFPGLSMNGGTFAGLPVITSQYVSDVLVLVNANDILMADDGDVTVDVSREASLEMDDSPSGDSNNGTGASLVSMFQTNSVAFLAERTINWARGRDASVQVITGVTWGGAVPLS